MSQENVDVIRAIYDRDREGDFRASADLLDPHVILVLEKGGDWGLDIPESGRYVGREAVALYTRDLLKPWTGFTMDAEEVVAAGDSVLVKVHPPALGAPAASQRRCATSRSGLFGAAT
jgi:ketosteroid isomerase-like protein